jgi:hypothetical protein
VDERFVIALPLALATRVVYFRCVELRTYRRMLWDALAAAAVLLPYVAGRLWLARGKDADSASYLSNMTQGNYFRGVPPLRFLDGFWQGLRGAWVFVGLVFWLWVCPRRWLWLGLLGLVVAGTVGAALLISCDLSRSITVLQPAALLGVLLLLRHRPRLTRVLLPGALAFNLLMPASHVVTAFTIPVRYFYGELDRYLQPPPLLNAQAYNDQGAAQVREGKLAEARYAFDTAIKLDPKFIQSYCNRGLLCLMQQELRGALIDADTIYREAPELPDSYFIHGVVAQRQGHTRDAIQAYRQALDHAAPDWVNGPSCRQFLAELGHGAPAPR